MLGSFRKGRANILIWALMAALIVGLAGFGIGVGGGLTVSDVARVGDRPVSSDDYVRALQQELRGYSQQLGRDMPMAEAREYGIDRQVLGRLINDAALDEEAARLGLSAGDDAVRAQVIATPAFLGADGSFSREAYTYALERIGMRPADFEELLRAEAARELVAGGVQSSVRMPDTAARTVLDFLGEKRGFDWMRLDAGLLPEPVAAPADADLAGRVRRPPRALHPARDPPDHLRERHARRAGRDDRDPRGRTARRLRRRRRDASRRPSAASPTASASAPTEEAAAAKARLDAGEIDFDALATERGLKPEDIDQGFVTADRLSGTARDAVFGAEGPGIVGPVDTPLGPSLYRINAILAATTTPFEEARAELARGRARAEAERRIHEDTAQIEDLLAGGATAEEIAAETVFELGTIALDAGDDRRPRRRPGLPRRCRGGRGRGRDRPRRARPTAASSRCASTRSIRRRCCRSPRSATASPPTGPRRETAEALTALAEGYEAELEGGLGFAALAERLGRPLRRSRR